MDCIGLIYVIMKELNANILSLSVVMINTQTQDTVVILILYTPVNPRISAGSQLDAGSLIDAGGLD